jgi:hypothetical protein
MEAFTEACLRGPHAEELRLLALSVDEQLRARPDQQLVGVTLTVPATVEGAGLGELFRERLSLMGLVGVSVRVIPGRGELCLEELRFEGGWA